MDLDLKKNATAKIKVGDFLNAYLFISCFSYIIVKSDKKMLFPVSLLSPRQLSCEGI